MRTATVNRTTNETAVTVRLALPPFADDAPETEIDTGVGFLDHMLTLFASHGNFSLQVRCKGDTGVDDHHSVEDIGIALGDAFSQALGDRRGIVRYGSMLLPMDEALLQCAVDICGRDTLRLSLAPLAEKVGTFDTELVEEFFLGFVRHCGIALHLRRIDGQNTHHILEGAFKAFGRAMRAAVAIDPACPDAIPSTKGTL